eukprot:3814475-Pleurochrysis_carterae.AAC.5
MPEGALVEPVPVGCVAGRTRLPRCYAGAILPSYRAIFAGLDAVNSYAAGGAFWVDVLAH